MKKKTLKEKLNNFLETAVVPDVLNQVKTADFELYKTDDSAVVPQTKQMPLGKKIFVRAALAMVAVLALVLVLVFVFAFDQTVYATVNVSVSDGADYLIEVNKKSQVINISADNQDGKAVLQGFSYKKKGFESTLAALLIACVDYWDINEEQLNSGVITYSVSCHDSEEAVRLQESFNSCMSAAKQHCKNRSNHSTKCS